MVSPAFARRASRTLQRALTHTYTRKVEVASDTENAWGDETSADSTVTTGVRCLYGTQGSYVQDTYNRDGLGARTISTPTLFVAPDDPLAVGDQVSNVCDASGAVILAGPATVETVSANAEAGVSLLKACMLRGADGRRGS